MTLKTQFRRTGEYLVSETDSTTSRATVTLAAGGDVSAGTVLGKLIAGGSYVPYVEGATDGSGVVAGILYDTAYASAYDRKVAVTVRNSTINSDALVGPTLTTAMLETLQGQGIIVVNKTGASQQNVGDPVMRRTNGALVAAGQAVAAGAGGPSAVTSVAGRLGDVALTAADVGLPLVNNTADANKPVSGPQAAAIATAFAAVAAPATVRVADVDALDLSRTIAAGGTATPVTAGQLNHVVAARTLVAGTMVPDGFFKGDYAIAAPLSFGTGLILNGHTPVVGDQIHLEVLVVPGSAGPVALAVSTYIQTLDVTKPVFGNPGIIDGDRTHIRWAITDASALTFTGSAAGIHITKNGAAIAVTAPTITGGVLFATLPSAAAYGDVYTATLDAGLVTDAAGNATNAVSVLTVTNSIVLPVPAAPVVTGGTNTTTQLKGTIAAGAGSSTITNYLVYYKKTADSTFLGPVTVAYAGASTAYSVDGLTADASAYQTQVVAQNASGNSAVSNVVTSSLVSSGITDSFTATDGTPIAGRTTETGGAVWFAGEEQTTAVANAQIKSNRAVANEAFKQTNQYVATPSANCTVAADCSAAEIHHGHIGGSGTANHTYVWMKVDASGTVTVGKKYKGTSTVSLTQAFAAGAHRLSITATGMNTPTPLYDCKVDGVSMTGSPLNIWNGVTGTQGANLGDGSDVYHGFLAYNTSAYVDTFAVTP